MPVKICYQETPTTSNQANNKMEGRFVEMEERLRRMTLETENLRCENEPLKQKSAKNATPSPTKKACKMQSAKCKMNFDNEEKRKMHQDLHHLIEKYMAMKVGTSSSVENLLNNIDLPYSVEIMMVSLPTKFKVLQMELYNVSKDIVEQLEMFKAQNDCPQFSQRDCVSVFPPEFKTGCKWMF